MLAAVGDAAAAAPVVVPRRDDGRERSRSHARPIVVFARANLARTC
jgi:hypothetical protein